MKGNNTNIELTLFFVFRYTYHAQWQNQLFNCRRQRRGQLENITKFGFFIETTWANSYRNFTIICTWPGADLRVNQEKHLLPVLQQIERIDSLSVLVNGAEKVVKIQL